MSPRPFLSRVAIFLLLACVGSIHAAEERWNILFVFADDWGRFSHNYAAIDGRPSPNDIVRTPNVDRVAREGVTFRHAFVNSPSCTPCRSSMLSGRYFFNTGRGAILRGAVWDLAIPSFPLMLRDAGYHIGKSHKVWGPGAPLDAPIGEQRYNYEKAGSDAENYSEVVTARRKRGETVEQARAAILAQVRGNFDAFLADRKPGQPWHYFFGPTNTHRLWVKGSGKALWGIDPDQLKGKLPAYLPDVPEVREDVADYLGEVQAVDAYLGVLLERLQALGELDKTLIVISGDHGMPGIPSGKCNLVDGGIAVGLTVRVPGGKGGRVVDDFVSLPDLAPTFMEIGGVTPPAGLYGRSLLPILRSERSGQIEPGRTWVIAGRERHVDVAREDNLPYPQRVLRTKDFAYIRNFAPDRWPLGMPGGALDPKNLANGEVELNNRIGYADFDASPTKAWLVAHRDEPQWQWHYNLAFGKRPAEELYDLRKDPDQIKNVATDPAYATTRAELSARLMKELMAAGDPRVTGDGKTFERPPFTLTEAPPPRNSPR
jgi:N-sulfoglucosamine sulfohydrolase